jgi:hypothetical protein
MFHTPHNSGGRRALVPIDRRQFLTGLAKFFAVPIAFRADRTEAAEPVGHCRISTAERVHHLEFRNTRPFLPA